MPAIGDTVEIAYTVPGCGNGLYRGFGEWSGKYWEVEDIHGLCPSVRYWRPATPLPNNGLYPGPLDD